ncbi:MAG: NADH-quinone oxidoreductase subunit D [Natronomonas sp.]|uniref:NADH-quinone oxidoreductase subunit D n=1 Tax=Natronomonas sp. TaxID=2184060 RepID=UPI002870487A|nr:NADH-quinone oxidoreductase subunit D [Natronomonas sp.]MDR9381017.1 NADH-quinone oxidoreductase subunit D [Natronomonas sp.]MDR9429547.1 NADH-quinone oxidoreductase subunit D [Natronomonas sp.]
MSLEEPSPLDVGETADGTVDYDALEALLGDAVVDREEHTNAPAFVVRADAVQTALSALKSEAGFDYLSSVTAQQYEDRFESIYHLKKYDDPTQEVGVVVPTPTDEPASQTAEPVYRTADWHEREAYDLVGIEYEGHPDMRRILLPETWQGHPLGTDYNPEKPQVVPFQKHANPLQPDSRLDGAESDTMLLNIGPHHPATHGVLHVKAVLDGEQIADVEPDIGYLHRCEEQMCQQSTYRHQIMPYPDRWDYVSAGILNEWAYARAAEDMADIEVPEYAQVIRTMSAELCRIASHMLALGTFALDVFGDFTAVFQYAFRDREVVQNILEDLTGQRLMFNYLRLGGVAWDLPEPREEFFEKTRDFLDGLPEKLTEYHNLITANEIFQVRCVGTGELPPEVAKQYGATGPVARGSGVDIDLRRDDPYGYYEHLDWDVVTEDGCDNYSRVLVRMREVEESAKIIEQCVDLLEEWPEDDREIQSNVPRTLKPDADTEVYRGVEAAKGELGIYMRSDGTDKPARFKIRSPCFCNLHTLREMAEGEYIPDLIASLGSLDIVLGEVDR